MPTTESAPCSRLRPQSLRHPSRTPRAWRSTTLAPKDQPVALHPAVFLRRFLGGSEAASKGNDGRLSDLGVDRGEPAQNARDPHLEVICRVQHADHAMGCLLGGQAFCPARHRAGERDHAAFDLDPDLLLVDTRVPLELLENVVVDLSVRLLHCLRHCPISFPSLCGLLTSSP